MTTPHPDITPPPVPVLSSRQLKYLRGLAHRLDPVVHVGHSGVTEGVIRAVAEALATHELVKVRLREPEDKRGDAETLARETRSALCGIVGHTVILYRPDPDHPRIEVP